MDIPQQRRVVMEIPGPKSRALMARRETSVPRGVFATTPVFVEAASGAIIRDVDGNSLIDLGAGLAVLNTGNTPPAVVEAVREQLYRVAAETLDAAPDELAVGGRKVFVESDATR